MLPLHGPGLRSRWLQVSRRVLEDLSAIGYVAVQSGRLASGKPKCRGHKLFEASGRPVDFRGPVAADYPSTADVESSDVQAGADFFVHDTRCRRSGRPSMCCSSWLPSSGGCSEPCPSWRWPYLLLRVNFAVDYSVDNFSSFFFLITFSNVILSKMYIFYFLIQWILTFCICKQISI